MDIIVVHSHSMTSVEAFNYFLEKVVNVESSDRRTLDIKRRMTPLLDGYHSEKEKISLEVIIVASAFSVITITAIVFAVVFVARGRNRGGKNKVTLQDKQAISMDNLSLFFLQ